MPDKPKDRILIVEHDLNIADFLTRQSLQAAGYETMVVSDAGEALAVGMKTLPDAMIVDLNLPGLSAKDLMVAMASQKIEVPVVILAPKGSETNIIQTFRLGAADYLLWPMREGEVINVVERVLKVVHARRERENLAGQLQSANRELEQRVRELTSIYNIGKVVISITDQSLLLEKLLDSSIKAVGADLGWFLLRDEKRPGTDVFILAAQRNLPQSLASTINQPWDDGVSSLVALSGQTLSINGEPLNRFKLSSLGKSALIVPVKAQKQIIGLLVVVRTRGQPFSQAEQRLVEAVVDYAAISLVNARLFRTLEERARALQASTEVAKGQVVDASHFSRIKKDVLLAMSVALNILKELEKTRLDRTQHSKLNDLQQQMQKINTLVETVDNNQPRISGKV